MINATMAAEPTPVPWESPSPAIAAAAGDNAGTARASGLAHVAVASFLAARLVPIGGFAVSLAGGAALARAGERQGTRGGYGTSMAALAQTVAIMGPSRFGVPLTQALSAPLLGAMHARGRGMLAQSLACGLIRLLQVTAGYAFFVWVVLGGLAVYAEGYDVTWNWVPGLPQGSAGALLFTAGGILIWTAVASPFQVWVYRRALRGWPPGSDPAIAAPPPGAQTAAASPSRAPRFDARAVALAAALAFAVLLTTTAWPVLGAAAVWLAGAWALARGERAFLLGGLVLAVLLAGGALIGGLLAGVGLDLTLRRTARAGLLVLVATWLRSAAGEEGLREVARRTLGRLRAVPSAPQAAAVLERLGSGRALPAAARRLGDRARRARRRPGPLAGAVLRWIAEEETHFTAGPSRSVERMRARPADVALVATALAPAGALMAVLL